MSFSVIGFLVAISIFIPNLFFVVFPPKNVPTTLNSAGSIFTLLERIGQIGCLVILTVSKDNYTNLSINIWFIFMVICIIIYYSLWIRYVIKGSDLYLCFKPLGFMPIPMAIIPVSAFGLAAVWGNSLYLGIATILLAIGHFKNTYHTYKLIQNHNK